ncbi:MAG: tetratricopeptide repeat protein [Thermomicrobiales bacterium]
MLLTLRVQAGLTQERLAERSGVSARAISDIERGRSPHPFAGTLDALSRALELAPGQRQRLYAAAQRPLPQPSGSRPDPHPALPPLIGRAAELAAIHDLLTLPTPPIVTLCGPGGIGKTRLAREIAAQEAWRYRHGAHVVDLAAIRDPDLVPAAIAQQLHHAEMAGAAASDSAALLPPLDALIAWLQPQQLLLVLDNLEQVLDAAPSLARLAAACPQVVLLVTSRSPLRVYAEYVVTVPPLPLPKTGPPPTADAARWRALQQNEAVRLFVERAEAHGPFRLDAGNAAAVVEICRRLDGLPLGIELAAARTSLLSPAAILARLNHALALLTGGMRDLPARHQTLENAIAWSYDLLDPADQRCLRRLAVFAGGAPVELAARSDDPAADDIHGLDRIAALAHASLVSIEFTADGQRRVRLLETIREFALARLRDAGEEAAARRAHALACLALAEQTEPALLGAEQARYFALLDLEQENIRAALEWAITTARAPARDAAAAEPELPAAGIALRLASAMWWYWETRGLYMEGQQWLEGALAHGPPGAAERRRALWRLGALAYRRRDLARARSALHEALPLLREAGDTEGAAWCQAFLGLVALVDKETVAARAWHEGALRDARRAGDAVVEAGSLSNLGEVAHAERRLDEAVRYYTASLAIARGLPDALIAARVLTNLAIIEAEQGHWPQAFREHQQALRIYHRVGDSRGVAASLEGMAAALATHADAGEAAWLYGAAAALRQRIGAPMGVVEHAAYETGIATARSRLTPGAWETAWVVGHTQAHTEAAPAALRLEFPGA